LKALFGDDEAQWRWGDLHKTVYAHFPFSKVKFSPGMPMAEESVVSSLFDRNIAAPGGNDTVNLASVSLNKETKYLQFFGPMYRQIIDLGAPSDALFMQGTGQSGNPVSPHYDDLILPNKLGRYVPMDKKKVMATLVLMPAYNKQAKQ
jgi:penicillin amidase